MKQGNALNAVINLDEVERQLKADMPRKKGGDDALAELARIVGQDDPFAAMGARKGNADGERTAPSFDDFLKIPPRPASGAMPGNMPPIEPLFPEFDARMLQDNAITSKEPAPDLGLRPDLSDLHTMSTADLMAELEAKLALAEKANLAAPDLVLESDAMKGTFQSLLDEAPVTASDTAPKAARFDDMLAEFDAAMRDAGAEKSISAPVQSLQPIVVPPPPERITMQSAAIGTGAAGAVVSAEVLAIEPANAAARSKRGLYLSGGVIGVAMLGVASLMIFGGGSKVTDGRPAPEIAAKPGAIKERPANPGGVEVPDQDKEVLQAKTQGAKPADTKAGERVAAREEQPVDLTQAQRQTQAAATGVRQIPGIGIVAPISTTPPAAASAQPVPRPVASVPITIAGQPAPTAPTPVLVAPVLATPVVAAPSVPAPAASTPASTASASAEPRKVRAVPIRTEDGAPARAQTQPRVVPANPRPAPAQAAAAPDEANTPLRITPQANRNPQRLASAGTPAATSAPAGASASGGFTVQLAAEGSEDAARAKFNRVKGQYSDVLGAYSPNIRSADVNGRSVYRVRVGSFSREEAVSLCERLKSSGGSCFVARN